MLKFRLFFCIKLLTLISTLAFGQSNELNSVLPEKAISLVGLRTIKHGPNCFNTALIGSSALDYVRYTSSLEMLSLLNSPICEKIVPGEQKPGDIQVYFHQLEGLDEPESLAHANIWLSKDLAFNKMSLYSGSAYDIVTNQAVLEKYQYYTDAVVFNQTQSDGTNLQVRCPPNIQCENKIAYFRCNQKIGDYILINTKNDMLLNVYNKIKIIEQKVEQLVFSKKEPSYSLISETNNLKDILLKPTRLSEKDLFIADYLKKALDSISKQYKF